MSTLTRLQRAALREAELQELAVQAFERQLQVLVNRLMRRLRGELAEWDVDDSGRLISDLANLGRAMALRQQLGEWLLEAGFLDLAARVMGTPFDDLAEAVFATSRIANEAAKLASYTPLLDAMKAIRMADLLAVSDEMGREIARITFEGMVGLRPVDSLVLDIADQLEVTQRQARTVYDTSVSTFARQVEQFNADGTDDELFVFVGPFDQKNRDFCEDRVGKVFPRVEIDAMDNGQLPDVFITGGGYNCRHSWKRVSVLDDELRALAGTGKRAPEIEALRRAA